METAEVVAANINQLVLEGLGLSRTSADSIPVSKVANMTTDTASVMSKAASILAQQYPLFKNMKWTPCSCHVLNLFLVEQEKQFPSVKTVLLKGKLLVTIFRNSGPRKLFQKCATSHLLSIH
jgi:hypothetical protein